MFENPVQLEDCRANICQLNDAISQKVKQISDAKKESEERLKQAGQVGFLSSLIFFVKIIFCFIVCVIIFLLSSKHSCQY